MNPTGYLMVRVAERWLGVPVARVHELFRPAAITPVPLAEPWVSGLINLRGRVVAALDLAACMGGNGDNARRMRRYAVLAAAGGTQVALLVDAVDEIVALPASDILPNPVTMPAREQSLARGVATCGDRLLTLLDLDGLAECSADVFAA